MQSRENAAADGSPLSPSDAERLDFIVQACGIGMWRNPVPLGELSWNANTKAHFHLPPEARVDMAVFRARLHPEDRQTVDQAIDDAMRRNVNFDIVYRTVSPQGSLKWIRAVGRPRMDALGQPVQFDGVTMDVTDLKEGQVRLQESAERLQDFADTAPAMLWGTEADGDCSFRSRSWYEFTGMPMGSGLGLGWLEAVHPDERESARAAFLDALALRARFQVEHRVRRADGSWSWVIDAAQPRFSADGGFVGFVGSVTDIDDRRRAEERLRESEERYRAFVSNSTEGIWRMEFDPPVDTRAPQLQQMEQFRRSGRFAECNHAFARMYGFEDASQLVGRGLDLMLPSDDPTSADYLRTLVEQHYRASELESIERDRMGNTLFFANSLTGTIQDGFLVRAWGTQRDITDRKRAELALLDADRRKDEFIATLAHELRNPLAPIRSAVELMRLRGPSSPDLARSRDIIDKQVSHLTRLIEDLLDISRITRDKLELRMERVMLADVVAGAVDSSRPALDAGAHRLQVDLPPGAVALHGDPVRLVQMVMNLLTNAARYSPAGSPVHLTARVTGEELSLRVRDEGQGIDAGQLRQIFEMFFQGGARLDRSHGGLGVGLWLVQRLARLHGGRVEAHSEGAGKGSEFTLVLPVLEAVGPTAAEPIDSPPPVQEHTGRRILVVDDNQDSADTLAEVLRLMDCETDTAYDGVEGVEKAERMRPDAIVLDLGMPRMNGYEACRKIRSQPWGRTVRIVAVSGWGQQEDRRRSAEAGFDAHLVKPVMPDVLLEVLDPQRVTA